MEAELVSRLSSDLVWIRPELLLAGFALSATLVGAWLGNRVTGLLSGLCALALVVAAFFAWQMRPAEPHLVFNGTLSIDGFSAYAKTVIALAAAATLLLGTDHFARRNEQRFEFPILIALSAVGMFVMVSANDLITLYVGLELQSLAAYVLAAFRRDDARSSEAGLKYFVLGALASGLLLYGSSLIYGFTGSVSFDIIAASASEGGLGVIFGLVFLICGLAFKMSAAPFHMWTPDVYEGAPTPITAFFAAAPKLAAVALLARVLYGPFAGLEDQWRQVIMALAGLSLLIGAFIALAQTNIKRLMAYSSIHNMGFALMALAAGTEKGASAALIYMTIYLPTTIGAFAGILAMRRDGKDVETIEDLSGLASRKPWLAMLLTVIFFSVAGIPPLAGFFGKLVTFQAALDAGLWPLAVIAALATVISAAYYLNIIKVMWVNPPAPAFQSSGPTIAMTAGFATLLIFPVLVVGFGWVEQAAMLAASSSFP
ncbi:MAG: NADH-quinone oxidoreductase subunit NuoN [Alphaproteobacteria bacterium]|nr:NADH-quinone oxidoreductase subunit NuoN [Alphaproteobacteria bacterium]